MLNMMDQLDPETFLSAEDAFATTARPSSASGPTYAQDFGSRKMARDVAILDMHASDVPAAWEACARNARRVKATVEEELAHASVYNVSVSSQLSPRSFVLISCLTRLSTLRERTITSHSSQGSLQECIKKACCCPCSSSNLTMLSVKIPHQLRPRNCEKSSATKSRRHTSIP